MDPRGLRQQLARPATQNRTRRHSVRPAAEGSRPRPAVPPARVWARKARPDGAPTRQRARLRERLRPARRRGCAGEADFPWLAAARRRSLLLPAAAARRSTGLRIDLAPDLEQAGSSRCPSRSGSAIDASAVRRGARGRSSDSGAGTARVRSTSRPAHCARRRGCGHAARSPPRASCLPIPFRAAGPRGRDVRRRRHGRLRDRGSRRAGATANRAAKASAGSGARPGSSDRRRARSRGENSMRKALVSDGVPQRESQRSRRVGGGAAGWLESGSRHGRGS